ncbi:MAG TPA: PKD domain-containing protein [Bacteroidia bacterium]|jgi:gliding motility-associated-like protein|nr:PKD domain-containing protein [Bacteroidia bacterium]
MKKIILLGVGILISCKLILAQQAESPGRFDSDTLIGFDRIKVIREGIKQKLKGRELADFVADKERRVAEQQSGSGKSKLREAGLAVPDVLTTPCNNLGFETGDFTGWTGAVGYNSNSTTALTVLTNGVNTLGINSLETSCSFHTLVTTGTDPYSALPMVDPGGGAYACRLGGENVNINGVSFGTCTSGSSPYSGGELIQQTFPVTAANALFTYNYMAVLEQASHTNLQVPFFRAEVLDANNQPIPCLQYYVESDSTNPPPGFFVSNINSSSGSGGPVFYCPWNSNSLNLTNYIGQNVTIRFTAAGCTVGGHFGYAYVDASCSPVQVISSTPNVCMGNSVTLTAPGAGTSGTYQWMTLPSGTAGITGSTTGQSVTINASGSYKVTVTQAAGCSYVIDTTITFYPNPAVSVTSTNASCSPGSDGTATATVTGVTQPYTLVWSPAPGGGQGTTQATGLAAGSYTITVTTPHGCTANTIATVVQPNGITLANSQSNVSCFAAADGTAGVTATGGTGTLTYSWSGSPTTISSVTGTATGLGAGTYTCTVSDQSGCKTSATFVISQPAPLEVTATGINTSCNNQCNGQLICLPSGGTTTYAYSWSTGCIGASCTNVCAGLYTVKVTDAHGCISTDTALVHQPAPINISIQSKPSHCSHADGSDSVSVSGGSPGYTYSWTPGAGTAGNVYSNIPSGTYTLYITDSRGCRDTIRNTVSNIPGVILNDLSNTRVSCFGGSDGTAKDTASSGTPPYLYNWTPAPGAGQGTSFVTGLSAGHYTCMVTDRNNCSSAATVLITQPSPQTVLLSPSTSICIGSCTNLWANASGGTPAYTYSWSQNGNASGTHVCPLQTTTYTVSTTDSHNCPPVSAYVTVTVDPPLEVLTAGPLHICPGNSDTLHANASGGNGQYNYLWMPSAGLSNPHIQNPVASPAVTTIYTVIIADNCGSPVDSAFTTVTIYPPTILSFVSTDTFGCAPLCINFTGTASPTCAGGIWTFGDGATAAGCTNARHCYHQGGNYTVNWQVTDINGCKGALSKIDYVNAYPVPEAGFTYNPQTVTMLDPEVTFQNQSTGGTSLIWYFGDSTRTTSTLPDPAYTYADTGCYPVTLVVSNQFGCTDTAIEPLCIKAGFSFYAPNTFTPNGDGLNDVWMPYGTGIDQNHYDLMLFDRWGNLMFETQTWGQGWDGRANGGASLAQIDTYVWKVVLMDLDGNHHHYTGHCNLIK